MTDTTRNPHDPDQTQDQRNAPSDIPDAVSANGRHWSLPLVWIIPILAALTGGWIFMQSVISRGPTITIDFQNAEGLEAGKTKIKYKEVEIGTVSQISLSDDHSHVTVTAQMSKQAESILVDDARFWVVRPRVTITSVTGLSTLLSGAYIGVDTGKSNVERWHFDGLESPPAVTSDQTGRQFVLLADSVGSLYVGAPVYSRGVLAGKVSAYRLDPEGKGVILEIFINTPFASLVTTNTRFWHASGIDMALDAGGIRVNTESLASIVSGGIAFEVPTDAPPAVEAASTIRPFRLFGDKTTALRHADQDAQTYLLYFEESLRGLAPGAAVDFRGIVIGEVRTVSFEYDRASQKVRFPVEIDVYPGRLRSRYRDGAQKMTESEQAPQVLLERLVSQGLRAQLKTANLLTGQLYVALDFFPNARKASIDWNNKPVQLPTIPGAFQDLQEAIGAIVKKLEKVPFDALGSDVQKTLRSLDKTLKGADRLVSRADTTVLPQLTKTLEQTQKTLANAEQTLSDEAPLQQDAREALREVRQAAEALRTLTDYLIRHPDALIRGRREKEK